MPVINNLLHQQGISTGLGYLEHLGCPSPMITEADRRFPCRIKLAATSRSQEQSRNPSQHQADRQ
jgi:hypothetical protein